MVRKDAGQERPRRGAHRRRDLDRRTRITRRAAIGAGLGLVGVAIAFGAGAFGPLPGSGSPQRQGNVASGTAAASGPTGASGTTGVSGTTGARGSSGPSGTRASTPNSTTAVPSTTRATTTTAVPSTTRATTTTTSTTTTTTLAPTTTTTVALPAPSSVVVEVLNGSGVSGQAAAAAAALQTAGFRVNGTANASTFTYSETVVEYPRGSAAAAETVAAHLVGAATLRLDEELPAGVVDLILGGSYGGVSP